GIPRLPDTSTPTDQGGNLNIKAGNIVTVTLECSYTDKQGQVKRIVHDGDEDGPIDVEFSRLDYMHYLGPGDEPVVRFQESDLRVDADWTLENHADRLFPHYYHSLMSKRLPLDPSRLCEHKGCRRQCRHRS